MGSMKKKLLITAGSLLMIFLELSKSCPAYDEVVEKLGEPSGKYGFGLCRAYWRIGERKYAEYVFMGDAPFLEIREY